MATLFKQVTASKRCPRWLSVGGLVLVAVSAGLMLPQVMPNATAVPESPLGRVVASQDAWTSTAPSLADGPDARSMLIRLGLGTVLVLGLSVGSLWLGKRWLQVKPLPTGGERQLRLLETIPLHGRCRVYLLQAGSQQVLVGADGYGLQALLPLEPIRITP